MASVTVEDWGTDFDVSAINDHANWGPWKSSGGNYYAFGNNDTNSDQEIRKSTDGGDTWTEQDASNAPANADWANGGLQAHRSVTTLYDSSNDYIWLFGLRGTSGSGSFTLRATYFDCGNDTWASSFYDTSDTLQRDTNNGNYAVSAVYQNSTNIWIHTLGVEDKVMGSSYDRSAVYPFNPSTPAWGTKIDLHDGSTSQAGAGPITIFNGDVVCFVARESGAGSNLEYWDDIDGTPTQQLNVGDSSTWDSDDQAPHNAYSASIGGTWEIGFAEQGEGDWRVLDVQSSTAPTSSWTETNVFDGNPSGDGLTHQPYAQVWAMDGDVRWVFAVMGPGGSPGNRKLYAFSKDGAGSWSSREEVYDFGVVWTFHFSVNLLTGDTGSDDAIFGAMIMANGNIRSIIWDRGGSGGTGTTKTHTTDAVLIVPGSVTGIEFPEATYKARMPETTNSYTGELMFGRDPSNKARLVIFSNHGRGGVFDDWREIDSHTFANNIESIDIGARYASLPQGHPGAVQLSNGDVYCWAYNVRSSLNQNSPPDFWRDTSQFTNGPFFTPRLVAQPGDPGTGEYGVAICGASKDSNSHQNRLYVFYHGPDSTKTRIYYSVSKHDGANGEFNSVDGGYFSPPQPLDPANTDDQYLAHAAVAHPYTDTSAAVDIWDVYRPHVFYTRVGASQTNLVCRSPYAATVFEMWTDATGGTFDVSWPDHYNSSNNIQTATNIAYNALAATIDTALEGMTNWTNSTTSGTGTENDPWVVVVDNYRALGGAQEAMNMLEPDDTNLTGGSVYVGVPTLETDLGQVKHQRRFNPDQDTLYQQNYTNLGGGFPNNLAFLGTDDKPLLVRLGSDADFGNPPDDIGEWDWSEAWPVAVEESGIGTKTVHSAADEYVPLQAFIRKGSQATTYNDWYEYRFLIFSENSTNDVIVARKILKDDFYPTFTGYAPSTESDWSYTTLSTENNPTRLMAYEATGVDIAPMMWYVEPGSSGALKPTTFAPWDLYWGQVSNLAYALGPETLDGDALDDNWQFAVSQGTWWQNDVWMDSNDDLHYLSWAKDRTAIRHYHKDSADDFYKRGAIKDVKLFSTTVQGIGEWHAVQDGDNLHVVTQEWNHDGSSVDDWAYYYHKLSLTTDTWTIKDELIFNMSNANNNAPNKGFDPNEDADVPRIAVRSDGYIAVMHLQDARERTTGVWDQEMAVSVRDTGGTWTKYAGWLPSGNKSSSLHGDLVYGTSDRLHVVFKWYNHDTSQWSVSHQSMNTSATKDTAVTLLGPGSTNPVGASYVQAWTESSTTYLEWIYSRPSGSDWDLRHREAESQANPTFSTEVLLNNQDDTEYMERRIRDDPYVPQYGVARFGSTTYVHAVHEDVAGSPTRYNGGWVCWRKGGYGESWSTVRALLEGHGTTGDGYGDAVPAPIDNLLEWEDLPRINRSRGFGGYTRNSVDYLWTYHLWWMTMEVVAPIGVTKTHTTDVIIAAKTVEHTTDAWLKKTDSKEHTTDAILSGANQVFKEHTTDVYLVRTKQHTTDAILILRKQHTTDAILLKEENRTHTTDTYIVQAKSHTTDVHLAEVVSISVTLGSTGSLAGGASVTEPVLQATGTGDKRRRQGTRTVKK